MQPFLQQLCSLVVQKSLDEVCSVSTSRSGSGPNCLQVVGFGFGSIYLVATHLQRRTSPVTGKNLPLLESESLERGHGSLHTQNCSGPPSNESGGRDREMEELHRELGETRFAMERLEIESRSVREVSDKRKKALDDALAKLQEKKLQVEKQAEELNKRAEDIDAVNKKYEEIQATLSQKESALRGLNSAHEQLRTRFNEGQRKMEDEKWELASKLDDINSKCEEQERRMKQFVSEIENLKSAAAKVQKRCSDAESVAEEKTKAMQRLKAELESREATISVFSDNRTHSEVFKMKLAECERSLAQESAQRASAESALEELRSKSGHLLKVEQEHNTAQEQLKWRKEQFGLLEEAHKKLQQQFQDQKDKWEGEKVGLITEISNLQTNLESQCRQSKDLELQLQRCNQALAHEESRYGFFPKLYVASTP